MSLRKLVAFADEGPECGTKPPGYHPPRPHLEIALSRATEPDPSPWRVDERQAIFWQSIQLHQVGQRLEQVKGNVGEVGGQVTASAESLFEGWCGSVPWSVLLQWLLHHPPPPPPWLHQILSASVTLELATKAGGDFGKSLAGAASALIAANLPQRQIA